MKETSDGISCHFARVPIICPCFQTRGGFVFFFSPFPLAPHGYRQSGTAPLKMGEIATTGKGYAVDRGEKLHHDTGWLKLEYREALRVHHWRNFRPVRGVFHCMA